MSKLSENLIALRKQANETQNDVADALEISNRTVSKWENGDSEPDCRYLIALAKHYRVTVDALLGVVNEEPECVTNDDGALQCFREAFKTARQVTEVFSKNLRVSTDGTYNDEIPFVPPVFEELGGYRDTGTVSSKVVSLCVSTEDNNLAYTLLSNKQNYRWLNTEAEELAKYFQLLANPRLIRLAWQLYHASFPEVCTAEYAAEKCGASVDEVVPMLKLMSWQIQEVELEGGNNTLYHLLPSHRMMVILAIAHEDICKNKSSNFHYGGYFHPILDEEESV